jgi:hypothetical protein
MDEAESLRKTIVELEKRASSLEKRYEKLIGKADEFVPRTTAIMREGVPLEIFSRLSVIQQGYEVFGTYSFIYNSAAKDFIERSVDIYAVRDSVYAVPEGEGRLSGQSWPERDHILIEVKQRKPGVEWVFSKKPTSFDKQFWAAEGVPIANTGFEIRPSEGGMNSNANPKDVNNAIAQLNQAYMPFNLALMSGAEVKLPGMSRKYASLKGRDAVYLVLITNAKLKMFNPPENFSELDQAGLSEDSLFEEVPWISFHPEMTIALQKHQEVVAEQARDFRNSLPSQVNGSMYETINIMRDHAHEVNIVHYDHLGKFFDYIKDPPRIEGFSFNITVDGKEMPPFNVEY